MSKQEKRSLFTEEDIQRITNMFGADRINRARRLDALYQRACKGETGVPPDYRDYEGMASLMENLSPSSLEDAEALQRAILEHCAPAQGRKHYVMSERSPDEKLTVEILPYAKLPRKPFVVPIQEFTNNERWVYFECTGERIVTIVECPNLKDARAFASNLTDDNV